MTPRPVSRPLARLAPLLLGATLAAASSPVTWEYPGRGAGAAPAPRDSRGRAAALEGIPTRLSGIAVGETGALSLSLPLREIYPGSSKAIPPAILWTAAIDPGGALFIGTGNSGEMLRIDPKGTGASYADTEELGVRAIATQRPGDLFLGTFPAGGVYRIGSSGQAAPFFDPEDRYIWALSVDPIGQLYVATGERGIIYRVNDDGEGKPFFDSDETHVTSMTFDGSGRLLAGTAPGGLLYRISSDARFELLLDTDLGEISSVAVTPEGTIFAAAIGEEPIQTPIRPGEKSDLRIEVTPASDGLVLEEPSSLPGKITIDLTELVPALARGVAGTAGRLYRIEPGRAPELVWKSDAERIYSLAWSPGRGLLLGTGASGAEGRVYRLEPDGTATMLHRMSEPQVTALLAHPDGRIYVCTSNPGRVYLVEAGSAPSGTFESEVYDAGHQARWGAIAWSADTPPGTRVELSTRSGNRPDPDGSWSDWTPAYAVDAGSQIASPAARFIQWKAALSRLKTDMSPLLRQVRLTLLPENRPPALRGLAILPAGAPLGETRAEDKERAEKEKPDKEKADEPAARKEPPRGSRWVRWVSTDPDGDTLSHTIRIKGPDEPDFVSVASGIPSSPWALQEERLAEGRYILSVEADDAPANGADLSLRDKVISEPFIVDHTPPRLEARRPADVKQAAGRLVVEIAATDPLSPIARGEFAADAASGPWSLLPCRDGICDTSSEIFRLDVAQPAAGTRLTIRVTDAAGNAATIEVPAGER